MSDAYERLRLKDLKSTCRERRLPVSGRKAELVARIRAHDAKSGASARIQALARGYMHRRRAALCGPAQHRRHMCTNGSDFRTLGATADIPADRFFSYVDARGFVYGCDIVSMYQLIKHAGVSVHNYETQPVLNPYDRNDIPRAYVLNALKLISLRGGVVNEVAAEHSATVRTMSSERMTEQLVMEVFQEMNALGNYAQYEWLWSLQPMMLVQFMRELSDVFEYRAAITGDQKRAILPPHGVLFAPQAFEEIVVAINRSLEVMRHMDYDRGARLYRAQMRQVLAYMRALVFKGRDKSVRCLGCSYVLGALTLVSPDAAAALPWLYDSFVH